MAAYVSRDPILKVTMLNFDKRPIFEQLWLKVNIRNTSYAIGVIYRTTDKNLDTCIDQLDEILSTIIPQVDRVVVCGDFNINLFNYNNLLSQCFDAYGFTQVINGPTRITSTSETLIDPMFVSDGVSVDKCGTINADHVADHQMVYCEVKNSGFKMKQKYLVKRDFSNFVYEDFQRDLLNIPWHSMLRRPNIDDKVNFFCEMVSDVFSFHAPIRTIRVSKPPAPWLTVAVKRMMKERDKALTKFRRTKLINDWVSYKSLRNYTLSAIRKEKSIFRQSV